MCSQSLETRKSRTLSSIFSKHMSLSWFKAKFMFYVDNKSFCALGNTTELNDLFVNFPVKGTCEGFFLLKLQAFLYQLQFYHRWTSFAGFSYFLTKSVNQSLPSIAFTQVVFTEKVCFIEITSFNYSFTDFYFVQMTSRSISFWLQLPATGLLADKL